MTTKFKKLKEQLSNLEDGDTLAQSRLSKKNSRLLSSGISSPNWFKYTLLTAFLGTFLLYAGINYFNTESFPANPIEELATWVNQPDEELLQGMGDWMQEMGYGELSREQLIELRQDGVTATFTSRMRDLGYTELTLEQLVSLRQNDVSSTFAAMMKELGYELTVDDLIQLRQHDVTAYYTSNLHDLGYTEVTKDELIRLRDTGVSTSEVERLIEERGEQPSIEELIRYSISNQ